MWKITIDMLNFYRSEAESVTIGREVDSLVDVLDIPGYASTQHLWLLQCKLGR